jgi:hypothetical protein
MPAKFLNGLTITPPAPVGSGGSGADLSATSGYWKQATAGANVVPVTGIPSTDLTFSGLTTGQVWRATGATAAAFGALDLANSNAVTGQLAPANGGMGVNNGVRSLIVQTFGGTLDFGAAGLTLTIPASGTAVLGTGAANRVATWSGTNTQSSNANLTWDGTWFQVTGRVAVGPNTTADTTPALYFNKAGQAAFDMHNTTTGGTPSTGARWRLFVDNVGGGGGDLTFGFYDVANGAVRFGITNGGAMLVGRTSGLTGAGDLDVNGNVRIGGNVGFYTTTPQAKQTVSGSRGGNAALASLCTALATLGLITNSTS